MDGSSNYQIVQLIRFEDSYRKLIKNHYKRDTKSRELFQSQINGFISKMLENPSSTDLSDDENFPKGAFVRGYNFRKIRFRMPGLDGSASLGRLMYVIFEEKKLIFPLWVYTHAEFPKRPHDADLRQEFVLIKNYIEEPTQKEDK